MMKEILAGCVLAVAASASAFETQMMSFEKLDGTRRSISAENLTIRFEGSQLLASNGSESLNLDLSDLRAFYFGEISGIEGVVADGEGCLDVYDTAGIYRGTYQSVEELRQALTTGTYIVKTDRGSVKLFLK